MSIEQAEALQPRDQQWARDSIDDFAAKLRRQQEKEKP